MPLAAVARRYADNLFAEQNEEIEKHYRKDLAVLEYKSKRVKDSETARHAERCISFSLNYIEAFSKARLATLLNAYDLAGVLFDDMAFHEVKDEIVTYAHNRQHDAIGLIGRQILVHEKYREEMVETIVSGVDKLMASQVRELAIKRDEVKIADLKVQRGYAASVGKTWDVFISHANEDKAFVTLLAQGLIQSGLSVWYNTTVLTVGTG